MKRTLGLVGARGYVGRELATLVERHDGLDLRLSISQRDGRRLTNCLTSSGNTIFVSHRSLPPSLATIVITTS